MVARLATNDARERKPGEEGWGPDSAFLRSLGLLRDIRRIHMTKVTGRRLNYSGDELRWAMREATLTPRHFSGRQPADGLRSFLTIPGPADT